MPSPAIKKKKEPKGDPLAIAKIQIGLERLNISCGFIDNSEGIRTERALRAYQESRSLKVTGVFDENTRLFLGETEKPFVEYTVVEEDSDLLSPTPKTWREKSQVATLGYADLWEALAEKFHCSRHFLRYLNPQVTEIAIGVTLTVPNLNPMEVIPPISSVRIRLSEKVIQLLDSQGVIQAHFPCSIAADKAKRPSGQLMIVNFAPNPNYTFDPKVFPEAALAEGITKKLIIAPGPNNPVGMAWIGLNLPGYGIHGSPEPEEISATMSHGCFRLSNWNAIRTLKAIRNKMPVSIEP